MAEEEGAMTFRWPRPSITIILLCALALIGFLLWSIWAHLDQISRAQGQVIPSGRVQVIQTPDGGVIQRLLVREGDQVRKGQLLMELDRVKLAAGVDEARARVAALKSSMARIQAELFNRPLDFPPDVLAYPDFVANQRMLYAKRRQALSADLSTLGRQRSLARQETRMNMPLLAQGDVSRADIIRMQRNETEIQGQIDSRRNRYLEDLQTDYTKTEEELASATQLLTQRQDALNNATIRSPSDGIVTNVRMTTVGGVLRPGDEVMEVVPTAGPLIVEAKIAPREIAFIHVGQPASVKFDAYDSAIYGAAKGRVTYVSADTFVDKLPDGREQPFYRVRLTVDTSGMHPREAGQRIAIQPGMTAIAEIKTGRTTVFRYITKPILRTASDAMGER
ncbi:MAG TPA: HlyD family type I secretion periplasmic adaptor subunit [Sphingomonadaceae bacterium]|nr:HlyD family type I secretion periplasmic adaptor subunit [Sphingomonadaceae bacterium]